MALTLKRYQREALAALARFFALARGARDEAALGIDFRQIPYDIRARQEAPAWR